MKHLFHLFILLPFVVFSQEYSYSNYDTKDGLAGSTVYCAAQDKEGFIWFGTETGLSRFDGTHFKNFTTADGLPDNEILRLYVDSKNRIWIIPFKNSPCYYWKGKIYSRNNDSILKKIVIRDDLKDIVEDKYGNILVRKEMSVDIIRTDGSIQEINEVDGSWFLCLEAGLNVKGTFRIVLGTEKKGVQFFDVDNGKIEFIKREIHPFRSYSIFPGLEVIRTVDSLYFFDRRRDKMFLCRLPENYINMWSLNDSLFAINAAGRSMIYNFNQERFTQEFLNGHEVTAVFEDREKNLWFTTMGEGIFRMGSTAFRNVSLSDKQSRLSVFSVYKLDPLIYLGTDHLLLWNFDPVSGKFQKQKISEGYLHGRVISLAKENNKSLFLGTDIGVFRSSAMKRDPIFRGAVKGLVFYQGRLLAASAEGLYFADSISNIYRDSLSLWRSRATCVFPHESGVYVGTLNGLYDLRTPKKPVYLGTQNILLQGRISAIAKSDDGIYWIATYGNGLVGYKNGKVIMHFSEAEGLSSNICRNIFIAGKNLWVGTDKGLNKISIDQSTSRITRFTTADGLSSDMVNALYVDGSMVYVGTPRGLTYFDEQTISQHSECVLRMTTISSSGTVWNYDTTDFSLQHKNNNIRFEFAGISYKSAGDIMYRYRLMGLDTSWKSTREAFLSYPSLPSGDYELQVIAVNKFGLQSRIKQVNFSIEELLVEKTWFRILFLIIAACFTWLTVWLYIKGIRKKETEKAKTLKKMAELEQMALKAQMNPHFIFNSLNSIQQYVMDKDTAGANRFITDFSSLMRQTLEFSSKQEISLREELQYIGTYLELEKVRMEDKFVYEIIVTNAAAAGTYYIPPMILQPFVENSIRHGVSYRKDKMGKIIVSVNLKSGKLICIIQDNGVGRKIAGSFKKNNGIQRQSRGMSLTADRIEMFNKDNRNKIEMVIDDLEDEQGNASGTRVTLSFPI